MPLLQSPIDGAPMRQIHRYGIEFDVCPTTGGVWLDKGELEKLVALVRDETRAEGAPHRERFSGHDDVEDFGDRGRHQGGRRSRLSDLFDF